jgi:hypothetical protein
MIRTITLLIILTGTKPIPVDDVGAGYARDEVFIHEAKQAEGFDDMSYGPQEFVVDMKECIYVHDICRQETVTTNRILKFDSSGNFLYAIDRHSIASMKGIWYGPMTIDPRINDLLILASVSPGGVEERRGYVVRFSESGNFLSATEGRFQDASFFNYDYQGNYYARNVDGATKLDSDFRVVHEVQKQMSKGRGYSQWTTWVVSNAVRDYHPEDSFAGKFLIYLRNANTGESIKCSFYHPPHHSFVGFIEGQDRYGNLILNLFRDNFVRINPITKEVAYLNLADLGIPRSYGDVRHDIAISPNGFIYKAALIPDSEKHLRFHVYRLSPETFMEEECELEDKE